MYMDLQDLYPDFPQLDPQMLKKQFNYNINSNKWKWSSDGSWLGVYSYFLHVANKKIHWTNFFISKETFYKHFWQKNGLD